MQTHKKAIEANTADTEDKVNTTTIATIATIATKAQNNNRHHEIYVLSKVCSLMLASMRETFD
jgi:hypothetical protein